MIGILIKIKEDWYVYPLQIDPYGQICIRYALYPTDVEKIEDYMEGVRVEFEIVTEFTHPDLYNDVPLFEGTDYAKIKN